MQIRPATAEDVPQVLPMVAKLAALHESWDQQRYPYLPNTEKRYDNWLRAHSADPKSVFLVAEADGRKIVGFAVATVETNIPIYSLAEYGYVHDVWVEEDYRHEGLGRQLVMQVIERLKAMNIKQVRLETAALNDVAREVFLKCGFRLSTIEMQLDL